MAKAFKVKSGSLQIIYLLHEIEVKNTHNINSNYYLQQDLQKWVENNNNF